MTKVIFTKDFATKTKGESWECDPLLANHLVYVDKVAVYGEPASTGKSKSKKEEK